MKSKLSPIFIIVGIFLFKVVLIDNVRHIGGSHQEDENNYRRVASNMPQTSNLKPIR